MEELEYKLCDSCGTHVYIWCDDYEDYGVFCSDECRYEYETGHSGEEY